jgi:Xaa-Pro aminopeptidase
LKAVERRSRRTKRLEDTIWADEKPTAHEEVQEMLLNVERASRLMDENGLDGLLASAPANVYYLSGLWNTGMALSPLEPSSYVLVSRDSLSQPVVVVFTGDMDTAVECGPEARIINYGTFAKYVAEGVELTPLEARLKELAIDKAPRADALEALAAAVEEAQLTDGVIGLDETVFKSAYSSELTRRYPKLKLKPAASVFKQIRMVKTQEEIRRLRAAVQVTEKAILEVVGMAREGITGAEMTQEFEKTLIDQGARPLFTGLGVGRSSAIGQCPPGDVPLRRGERIWFDVGCKHQGYSSDVGRTFSFGDPDERTRRYYQATLEGQKRGLETAKAGATAAEVYHATMAAVESAGIPNYRRRHVGHGMGISGYDPPLLAPGDETILEEGMVMAIEPPYYELGTGAILVEDTFVVTKGQPELLTSLSRELEIIG